MTLDFSNLKRNEIKEAAALAARSFDSYAYFTNWFPEDAERHRVLDTMMYSVFSTNYRLTHYLKASADGTMAAVAQLDPPSYHKPSDLRYFLHRWMRVYKGNDRRTLDDWLSMDEAAGQPCHDFQKTGPGIWYGSLLTVDPIFQGSGIGTRFLAHWEDYVRRQQGRGLVLFTNSQKNLEFYLKNGYQVFDECQIRYNGNVMGSWSLSKSL